MVSGLAKSVDPYPDAGEGHKIGDELLEEPLYSEGVEAWDMSRCHEVCDGSALTSDVANDGKGSAKGITVGNGFQPEEICIEL